jgi:hypothetical protein
MSAEHDANVGIRNVRIRGPRLLLRALRPDEIEDEWRGMVTGWLDLAIDLDGASIGRIQTFVPPGRPLAPGTFEVGIGLRADYSGWLARLSGCGSGAALIELMAGAIRSYEEGGLSDVHHPRCARVLPGQPAALTPEQAGRAPPEGERRDSASP